MISQDLREPWNKGKLFNAGFQIAMKGKNDQKYIIRIIKYFIFNPQAPVAQKIVDEFVFRRF